MANAVAFFLYYNNMEANDLLEKAWRKWGPCDYRR